MDDLEEAIFFGTVPCHFKECAGGSFGFDARCARSTGPVDLAAGHDHLFVVTVPRTSVELERCPPALPELQAPLVPAGTSGTLRGLASGVRSGLLRTSSGSWLRLKGCGNNDSGFPLRNICAEDGAIKMHADGAPMREIRGCCFAHTAAIELSMSHTVDEVLKAVNMRCANRPIGWFEYELADAPYAAVSRRCAVFETVGDRRLTDHVLRGLELLFPILLGSSSQKNNEIVKSLVPEGVFGPRDLDNPDETVRTYMQLTCGAMEAPHLLTNASTAHLHLRSPTSADFPGDADAALRPLWDRATQVLETHLRQQGDAGSDLLGYLYWHFGFEAGTVMRVMQAAGISWGTFRDLTGTHCNAHGNNLVLLRETAGSAGPFLAPLDLDLAYTLDTAHFGGDAAQTRDQAQEYLRTEPPALAMDLGMYAGSTGTKNDHPVAAGLGTVHWGLRDTMARAFLEALAGKPNPVMRSPEQHAVAYALLRLALIVTNNVIA